MAKPTPLEPPVTMAQRGRSELRSTSPKREGAFHRSMQLRSSISQTDCYFCRLSVRLRRSRSNTSTEYTLPGRAS